MSTETIPAEQKKPDPFAKARAVQAARRAEAKAAEVKSVPAGDDRLDRLEAMMLKMAETTTTAITANQEAIKELSKSIDGLKNRRMPSHPGPEQELGGFLKEMKVGDSRDGVRMVKDLLNPRNSDEALRSGDYVAIKPDTWKYMKWAESLKLKPGEPIVGKVLQYLDTPKSGEKAGQRTYKVHFKGIGRDGVAEDEIEFLQAAG